MKIQRNQCGYTSFEVCMVLCVLSIAGIIICGGYVLFHFISKIW